LSLPSGGGVSRKADGGGSYNWVGGWATLLASPFKERWHEVPERLPSPVGEGVTAGDGWGVSPLGDSRRMEARGTTHSNYPHLASPFGRGVLRKQDGEGSLLLKLPSIKFP